MSNYELEFEKEIQKIIKKLIQLGKQNEIVWINKDVYEIINDIEHHIYIGEKKDAESY